MSEQRVPDQRVADETERVAADWARRGRHWDKRADEIADQAARMNAPLIEAADIQAGQTVCDIATGAGEPALTIAGLVGPEGRVFATDLVPEMLMSARRRAAAQGIRNIEFRTADMLALPDADGVFDRVTCRFGIMFCPDPAGAAAEAHRVLKPGGRAAYMVWGPPEDTTMFAVFRAAADAVFPAAEEVKLDLPFSLGASGALEAALRAGGFADVEERELRFAPRVPAEKPFWLAQLDMALGAALETASMRDRQTLEDKVWEGFQAFRDGDEYALTVHARIGIGVRR